jgi:hypothetical protein
MVDSLFRFQDAATDYGDLANELLTTVLDGCGSRWTLKTAHTSDDEVRRTALDPPGSAKPPEKRKAGGSIPPLTTSDLRQCAMCLLTRQPKARDGECAGRNITSRRGRGQAGRRVGESSRTSRIPQRRPAGNHRGHRSAAAALAEVLALTDLLGRQTGLVDWLQAAGAVATQRHVGRSCLRAQPRRRLQAIRHRVRPLG